MPNTTVDVTITSLKGSAHLTPGFSSSALASLPTIVRGPAAAVGADGRIYFFGGYDGTALTGKVQAYSITSNT